ncbi:exostosin family protein [Striga asiatica]|uniref:Exostosin family protein n=1 Tax=Striga asiatica TaxID=4170 RepID=A0A5A7Q095_STRAF|nr:exostosin family protein [Striga asiatica]
MQVNFLSLHAKICLRPSSILSHSPPKSHSNGVTQNPASLIHPLSPLPPLSNLLLPPPHHYHLPVKYQKFPRHRRKFHQGPHLAHPQIPQPRPPRKIWALTSDHRIGSEADNEIRMTILPKLPRKSFPYPENPIIKQYSAEYWILGDLLAPEELKRDSFARRVFDPEEADVIFVPFFATLSAELQLVVDKSVFRKKVEGNEDYVRQRMAVDLVKKTAAWKRSGGRDHVFVLTGGNVFGDETIRGCFVILKDRWGSAKDGHLIIGFVECEYPVAMWHVKDEIAPAILLVVDFGGWYRLDSKTSNNSSSSDLTIHHTQVSLLKDVIVPYTHLLPRLDISKNAKRDTLLYFKGAKHRHRPGVVIEEGFPNATVIVSDNIELPFEGILDYSEFSVFMSVSDALRPSWLVGHLRSYSGQQKDKFRENMAKVQPVFEYANGQPKGVGPTSSGGAVNHIWKKVYQKLPMIREAITRERRKLMGVSVQARCHCI